MEQKDEKRNSWQKWQLIIALIATVLLALMAGTLAWLTYVRRLQTATLVDMPNLIIQGPYGADSAPIELGDIDVTDGSSRQYVFSISAINADYYKLQLAHTTNIPFHYTIYPAKLDGNTGTVVEVAGHNYTYSKPLAGGYLNQDATTGIANSSKHTESYGDYTFVQENVEPLYWQSSIVQVVDARDYYVLDVSWKPPLTNNKETDIIYLTVVTETKENAEQTGEGT